MVSVAYHLCVWEQKKKIVFVFVNSQNNMISDNKKIYHRSPMQTEKSQSKGRRIMPETSFTEFPALSFNSRVGISRSALETDI